MNILFYGETPCIETGAARVSRYILAALAQMGHSIEVVAINHPMESYSLETYPYEIHPCPKDEMYNLALAAELIQTREYDLLFLTGDINIMESLTPVVMTARERRHFILITLAAIDCDIFYREYLRCLEIADYPVVYSQYAYQVAVSLVPELGAKLRAITLGCEPDVFYPIDEEERERNRKEMFLCGPDDFLVINVNRNQLRKDIARSLKAFHLFHELHPKSRIYVHAKMEDQGGCLPAQARFMGMRTAGSNPEIIFSPPGFHEMAGIPRERMNAIYTAADVAISTSTGEGWGLTTSEALCAETPFIGPRNTTFVELLGEFQERGFLVECGGPDLWAVPYGHGDSPRDLTSVTGMVEALEYVYYHREEARERARRARTWTLFHTWEYMQAEWRGLLKEIEEQHNELRKDLSSGACHSANYLPGEEAEGVAL